MPLKDPMDTKRRKKSDKRWRNRKIYGIYTKRGGRAIIANISRTTKKYKGKGCQTN